MTQGWVQNLLFGVGGNLLSSIFVLSILAIAYWLWLRSHEWKWVREHGLMLLVYFRNVDWRCEKRIRHQIKEARADRFSPASRLKLKLELVKLQADLDAFEQLAQVWGGRLALFPFWHPYGHEIRDMLEAHAELHVALVRHISPLLHYLEIGPAPSTAEETSPDPNLDPMQRYADYFVGERDRLWRDGLWDANTNKRCEISSDDPLEDHRDKRLYERLKKLHDSTRCLLERGDIDLDRLCIWSTNEEPARVWFNPSSDGAAQSDRVENRPGSPSV